MEFLSDYYYLMPFDYILFIAGLVVMFNNILIFRGLFLYLE